MIDQPTLRTLIKAQLSGYDHKTDTPDLSHVMTTVETILLDEVMIYTRGNVTKAAKIMGINRGTARRRYDNSLQHRKAIYKR